MPKIIQGFKDFIMRGNAVDLAVGVLIGASFNNVVNSLVKGLLTPLIGAVVKNPDFSGLSFTLNGSKFMYGDVINSVISFLLSAFAAYFFVVAPMNGLRERIMRKKEQLEPATKQCPFCLMDIPARAKRCGHCTQLLETE